MLFRSVAGAGVVLVRLATLLVVSAGILDACSLLVAAAADLAPLERRLTGAFPDCKITFSFASSGTLARQVEQGAEFDVFLSASKAFVEKVLAAGAADASTVRPYARGRIGLWSHKGLKWANLKKASRISIANPVHAPYGLAAKQALEQQGVWESVRPKIVFGENVRQAWQFAVTGNVDVTIASWSMMRERDGELLPASWHDPIVQVAVIPKRARNREAARKFLEWLTSPAGQQILASEGFDPAR